LEGNCGDYTGLVLSRDAAPDTVTVPLGEGAAIDAGDGVAAWLQAALKTECRLVRRSAARFDSHPFSVVFQESVDDLAGQLACTAFATGTSGLSPSTAELAMRFRPNFCLSGFGPWPEQRIGALAIGGVLLAATSNAWASGCRTVTRTNPITGEIHPEQPAAALCSGHHMMEGEGDPIFGMKLEGGTDAAATACEGHIVIAEPRGAPPPSAEALAEVRSPPLPRATR
jgi:uncharacterized protein YcbX